MTNTHIATESDCIVSPGGDAAGDAAAGDRSPPTPLSLASYRAMFELAPEAIVLGDATGRYIDANAKALALLGYDREEFLHLSIWDTSALGPSWGVAEFARFRCEGHWEGNVEVRAKDGTLVPVEVRAGILPGADGPHFVAFLRDRGTLAPHDLARARLAAIVRSSADAIVGETLDGIITDWNPAAERMYGYTAEEAIGQPLTLLAPPERKREIEMLLARVVSGESIERLQTVRRTKNGQLVPVALTLSPVRDERGEVIAASAIVRDISAYLENMRALAMSEARYRALVDYLPAVVYTEERTPGDTLTYISPSVETLLGYAPDAFFADRGLWTRCIHPEDQERVWAAAERMHQTGERFAEEYRLIGRDGRTRWVSDIAVPLRDENGRVLCSQGVILDITERIQTEVALRQSEELFRATFEHAAIGMDLIDPEGRFLQVNPAFSVLTGYSEEELRAMTIRDITHPDDIAADLALLERLLTGQTRFYAMEKRYLRKDGGIVWVRLTVSLVCDEGGAPLHCIGLMEDITARKQVEDALRASETRYRALVEQVPAVVYVLAEDENQTPLYYNPYIEKVTGMKPEEAVTFKGHWLSMVHPDDRERVAAEEARTAPLGLHFNAEYRHLRKDGGFVWVHDECVPIRDDAGQIVAWQGVMFDISERMQADEAKARLAAIVESAEDAIVSRALDGAITSWNRGAERLYGYTAAEMIGRSFTVLLPEDRLPASAVEIEASGTHSAQFETRRRRKDGQLIDVAISLSPIQDARGELRGVSTITRDITARKQLEQDLRAALDAAQAAQRATTQFLGMMSHELRTPMQSVLGYSDLLLANDDRSLSPEQREDVRSIKRGASRMMRLIEQMLSLSRLEAGRLEVNLEPVDLATVCEQVRHEIAPLATAKGLALVIALPPNLPAVLADVAFLHQILLNLVENGIKFTERGEVRLWAQRRGDALEVAVSDTGIGITVEALPHIFDEFWQVDAGPTRRYGGAGLGLAITRKLVALHGGRLAVTSQLGLGSTFTVCLPAHPTPSTVVSRESRVVSREYS